MRLLAAILLFGVCVAACAELITIYPDGVNQELEPLITVYQDGVAPVSNGDGGTPVDPNALPQADSILWLFGQFEEGTASGLFTNLLDYSTAGTNTGLMLGSMVYEDLETTLSPRYKFDATDANRLFGGVSSGDSGWNVDQLASDTNSTIMWWWEGVDNGTLQDQFVLGYQPDDNISQLTVRHIYSGGDDIAAFLYLDGVLQWDIRSPANFLDDKGGVKNMFEIKHAGVSPTMWHNGVQIANVTTSTATDLTIWINDIATLASSKADYLSFGYLQDNLTIKQTKDSGDLSGMMYWPLALTAEESTNLFRLTSTNNGTIAYDVEDVNFDSASGIYSFEYDSAGNTARSGGAGTMVNVTFAADRTNGFGSYNGVNSHTLLADPPTATYTSFTFSVWAYNMDNGDQTGLTAWNDDGVEASIFTDIGSVQGQVNFFIDQTSSPGNVSVASGFAANEWHMYTYQAQNGVMARYFLDGQLVVSNTFSTLQGPPSAFRKVIGNTASLGSANAFFGYIDEARMYSNVLSTASISNLFNATEGLFIP